MKEQLQFSEYLKRRAVNPDYTLARHRRRDRRIGKIDNRRLVENTERGVEVDCPMDPIRTIKVRWVMSAPDEISYHLARFQFARPVPMWQPAINAYRCDGCVRVCVDLAGVERADIDLLVEPKHVTIRGTRDVPERTDAQGDAVQMLIMEIDYGPFERMIALPEEIDVKKAYAEQENGLLWIYLPLKP